MSGSHLSDLALDGLRLDRGAQGDQSHLDDCGVCVDRLAELVADAAAFEDRFEPRSLAAQTLDRGRPTGRRAWLGGLVAAAAAAALLVVALPALETPGPADRIKGSAAGLKVRVKRDGVVTEGRSGQVFKPGDALMIGLQPGRNDHVRLVYRDSQGAEAVWFEGAAPSGRWTWTDGSFVLDGAHGRERLTAVYRDGAEGEGETVVFEVRKE